MTPYMIRKLGEQMILDNPGNGHKQILGRLMVSDIAESIEKIYNEAATKELGNPSEALSALTDFVTMWLSEYIVRNALIGKEVEAGNALLDGMKVRLEDLVRLSVTHLETLEAELKRKAKNAPPEIRSYLSELSPEEFRNVVISAERVKVENDGEKIFDLVSKMGVH